MPRGRFGAALLVPEPWRREIDALRRATGDGSLGRIPAHLTLVPPVNVHDRDVGAMYTVLRDAAADGAPLRLDFGPPGTFLPENPVLYLEVHGPGVGDLVRLRDRVFRPPLERKLSWPFVPHVTLCEAGDPERLAAAALGLAGYRATVTFDRVHLLREERDAEGRRVWRPHADAALGGRRVVGRGGLELEITESATPPPEARAFTDAGWAQLQDADGRPWREEPFALVARREGEIVGTALGWTNEGVAHLNELMVGRAVRGEGIGGHLLAAFEDLAVRRGCRRLSLATQEDSPARRIYEDRGWRVEAALSDWVGGRTMVRMRKDL